MYSLYNRKIVIFLRAFCILLLLIAWPVYALIIPPNPFDSTDRFALLMPASDETIIRVQAKIKAPGPDSLGAGELWALLQYKLPSNNKFFSSASNVINSQGLSTNTSTLIDLDFSNEPIPVGAYHRTLHIYYHETSEALPTLLSEYRPEQLILPSSGNLLQNQPIAQQGTLVFGPVTFLRERERPKTEQIPFTISDSTGLFILHLINGTSNGIQRVSSAVVKLNGKEVFRPSEFNQKVAELSRQVTLMPGENLLEVRLRSAPGASITLELYRLDNQACSIFGPKTFIRKKGKPVEETQVFELKQQFLGPFRMNLINGDANGSHRVDSAVIKLNGDLVFGPSSFNEQVQSLFQVVSLQSTNTLSVELRGAPGDLLSIEIIGFDSNPPSVAITNPSNGVVFNASPISVSGIVDDASSSVTVNGIAVSVGSNGTFTVDGITLVEGENPIRVVATDSCGNQGEDQILVYLRTVPQGPTLILCAEPFHEQVPEPPGEDCSPQAFGAYYGVVTGLTDETAVSVVLNGVLLPDGVETSGDFGWGMRDGNFFWAFINIPQVDGTYPFTAVVSNAEGGQTQATVYLVRETVPPVLTVTSPSVGFFTNTPTITITGTVDDPEATVRIGWTGPLIPVVNGTFTTKYILPKEGSNYLTITARDPAGNFSFVSRTVILDTQPPQINVTYPPEGKAVNTSALNVSGSIVDQNINEVTVLVAGGQPQLLTLTGKNFSGTVTLSPGSNTLTFYARDKAGNTSSATRSVLLDLGAPIVNIISPQSGAMVSGTLTVQVEANDAESGIGSVALFVDDQLFSTLNQPPFDLVLDTSNLAAGPHTIMARAVDKAGNQSEASIIVSVTERFRIEILSPSNGATINKSMALGKGRIYGQMGEVGVVVNGVLAEVQGSDFAAIVPLQIGQNLITATATRPDGVQGQAQITINTETQQEFIRLTATPTSGILDQTGILNVIFEAEAYLVNPVSFYSWDFNGDGISEIVGIEATVEGQYQYAGLYFPRVTITDNQGNIYSETTFVNVLSGEEMDALLRSKWEGMKGALLGGNIETALTYFVAANRNRYNQVFTDLGSNRINSIFSNISEFKLDTLYGQVAECGAIRMETAGRYSYPATFVKDENGIWKIYGF